MCIGPNILQKKQTIRLFINPIHIKYQINNNDIMYMLVYIHILYKLIVCINKTNYEYLHISWPKLLVIVLGIRV